MASSLKSLSYSRIWITFFLLLGYYFQNYEFSDSTKMILFQGNTSQEDVGGEDGYDEFLQVISDPNHPEYQDMLSWCRAALC
jgi:hypothetical protein